MILEKDIYGYGRGVYARKKRIFFALFTKGRLPQGKKLEWSSKKADKRHQRSNQEKDIHSSVGVKRSLVRAPSPVAEHFSLTS